MRGFFYIFKDSNSKNVAEEIPLCKLTNSNSLFINHKNYTVRLIYRIFAIWDNKLHFSKTLLTDLIQLHKRVVLYFKKCISNVLARSTVVSFLFMYSTKFETATAQK